MNTLGRKLRNTAEMIGRKSQRIEQVGRKVSGQALQGAQRVGSAVDVAGRKIGNTSQRVSDGIGAVQPYLNGIVGVETLANVGRDLAKGVNLASQGSRRVGQSLQKESKLLNDTLQESTNFV